MDQQIRVLVVDDDESHAEAVAESLERVGYECVVATSGREATSSRVSIVHPLDTVRLLAPVPRPPGIACFITWSAHVDDSRDKGYTMLKFPELDGDLHHPYRGARSPPVASNPPPHPQL